MADGAPVDTKTLEQLFDIQLCQEMGCPSVLASFAAIVAELCRLKILHAVKSEETKRPTAVAPPLPDVLFKRQDMWVRVLPVRTRVDNRATLSR